MKKKIKKKPELKFSDYLQTLSEESFVIFTRLLMIPEDTRPIVRHLHRAIQAEFYRRAKEEPNETTLKAIKQLETGKGAAFDSVDDLLKDLRGEK